MDFLMQLLTGLVENQQGSQWGVDFNGVRSGFYFRFGAYVAIQ